MTAFRLAVLHLARRRFSTAVAILCVGAATLASGALLTILTSVASPLEGLDTPYDAIVGPKSSGLALLLGALGAEAPSPEVIPHALADLLERKGITRSLVPLHACGRSGSITVFATDRRFWMRPPDLHPPEIASGTWFENLGETVLGASAMEASGLGIGDSMLVEGLQSSATLEEKVWKRRLTVVGELAKTGSPIDQAAFVSRETGNEAYLWAFERGLIRKTKNQEAVTYLWVSVLPGNRPSLEHWVHSGSVGQYIDTQAQLAFLRRVVGGAKTGGLALGVFILFLEGIGIAVLTNSRYETIRPELGVLRALGYARYQVAGWIVWESLLISMAGLALALLVEAIGLGIFDLPYRLEWSGTRTEWPSRWTMAVSVAVVATPFIASSLALIRLYRSDVRQAMQGC